MLEERLSMHSDIEMAIKQIKQFNFFLNEESQFWFIEILFDDRKLKKIF